MQSPTESIAVLQVKPVAEAAACSSHQLVAYRSTFINCKPESIFFDIVVADIRPTRPTTVLYYHYHHLQSCTPILSWGTRRYFGQVSYRTHGDTAE